MTRTASRFYALTKSLTFSYFLELLILLHIFADTTGGTRTHARTVAHNAFRTTARARQTRSDARLCRQPEELYPEQVLPTVAAFLPIELSLSRMEEMRFVEKDTYMLGGSLSLSGIR